MLETAKIGEEQDQLREQLLQSQKMEGMGRLAGGMAHDFNNLLTVILSYAQLGTMAVSPGHPAAYHIQAISEAADRATNLTRQPLAFSRRQPIELKVSNLNDLILEPGLAPVKVDPNQAAQALINVAINARDAMPAGGKLIIETANADQGSPQVPLLPESPSGRYVMVTITDTGVGMTEEIGSHVFERFFTTKELGKGTGLGLASCYSFVKQSGGHIEVRSKPNEGATFQIYLPSAEDNVEPQGERLPRGTETVLLVEDEPMILEVVGRILEGWGYRVVEASNCEEALRVVGEQAEVEIDLLLTDLVMPRMGGKELAKHFKASRPKIKVVFTSGYLDEVVLRRAADDGRYAFLQKPFRPEALALKVREVLDDEEPSQDI